VSEVLIPKTKKLILSSGILYNLIESDAIIPSDEIVTINGLVIGDIDVESGAKLELNGMIQGNLKILTGGKAIVNGIVSKSVENFGEVAIYGKICGNVTSHNDNITINPAAVIGGRVSK